MLALDLVKSWSFERPTASLPSSQITAPPSPNVSRAVFALEPARRHRSSILIDMNINSLPPTGATSPMQREVRAEPLEALTVEPDSFARKAGIGTLMQAAKKDVQIPDFDMNSFF